MIRKIVKIDREKCNGCGLCVKACHEGAIGLDQDGRARLLRDDYCDGLGDCLPACPTGAISFEEREALPYDEKAVLANMAAAGKTPAGAAPASGGCPGLAARSLNMAEPAPAPLAGTGAASSLRQWPVQLKLVPVSAPYFAGADLLVAADCTAYAHGSFHADFMRGKVTLIACPKLDGTDYSEKLAEIFRANPIRSVTVARMSVPCCGGLEQMVRRALAASGKDIPASVVVISPEGQLARQEALKPELA